jgi:crossover junction endodeoxyribonuclease RuvC
MGYSAIRYSAGSITLITLDVLKLPTKKDNYERLKMVYEKVSELMQLHRPDELAIEAPFFGKNVQSMLKLGRAQGVAIAAAMGFGIPVTEYSPKRIKQAITGKGNADKEQVWKMMQHLVALPDKPKYYDASDALAVAICHSFSNRATVPAPVKKKKPISTWEKFAAENPARIAR